MAEVLAHIIESTFNDIILDYEKTKKNAWYVALILFIKKVLEMANNASSVLIAKHI